MYQGLSPNFAPTIKQIQANKAPTVPTVFKKPTDFGFVVTSGAINPLRFTQNQRPNPAAILYLKTQLKCYKVISWKNQSFDVKNKSISCTLNTAGAPLK